MGTQQREAWFRPRPDDGGDRREFMSGWQPIGITLTCGRTNPALDALTIPHKPCDRARGHEGACSFEAL